MKQAIHLLDPVNGKPVTEKNSYPQFPLMRCGRTQNFNSATPLFTTNTAEVTCTSCQSYINNPWRVLRKYGHVKVVEDMFVMVWGQYGYKFDMCAMIDAPGCWNITVSYNGRWHLNLMTKAGNTTALGFKLVDIIEAEIMKLKSPLPPFAKGDEEPETSIQYPKSRIWQPAINKRNSVTNRNLWHLSTSRKF